MSAEPRAGEVMVELVDERGRASGQAPKLAAHQAPGQLHRALSVFLADERGRLLPQRRAAGKYHSAGLWSNTCCSHPAPGEAPLAAAARRAYEELGIEPVDLAEVGTIHYHVTDPVSGLVEHEWDHLLVGRALGEPLPDPGEVDEYAAVPLGDLDRMLASEPFTAWFRLVLEPALPALRALAGARPV